MHYTLVDFVKYTNAVKYLIAVIFALSFVDFWRLLHKQEE